MEEMKPVHEIIEEVQAEIQLTSGKGRKMKDKIRESQKVKVTLKESL